MFHKNRMAYEDDMVKSLHMPFLSQISLFSHIILSSKDRSCHAALFSLFLLVQHLPCVSGTKSIGFLSVSGLYSWEWIMLLLSTEASSKSDGPFFWEITSEHFSQEFIFSRPSLAHKGCGYSIFHSELSVGVIGIYGIGSNTSYPYIYKLLLYTDTILKSYTLIESLEWEVLDERPFICMLPVFTPNSTDFVSFLLTNR